MMKNKRKNCKANSRFQIDNASKLMPISKHSQGHIEIILSFLIFIGFLLFMFIFINPFASIESKDIIDNIKDLIINDISDEVGKLSIIVDNNGDCYDRDILSNYGTKYLEVNEGRKYTVYFNDIFGVSSVPACDTPAYTLGTYSTEKMIIYEKIQELRTNYINNYEDLKTSLGILDEFAIELKRLDGGVEIGVNKEIPFGIEVKAVNIPIRVINSNGEISEFILNILVW